MIRTLTRATYFSHIVIATLLFATAFATSTSLFQHLITAKQWRLEQATLLVIVFLLLSLPFVTKIKVRIIDAGVLLFSLWWVLNQVILQTNYISFQQTAFQVVLWLTIYLFMRTGAKSSKFIPGVVIIFLLTSLLQSALGLLQLYGYQASFHSLFKITGTFHNPGPFSGFVVSALPLALVGYKMGYTEWHRGDTEIHREISFRGAKINFNGQEIFRGVFRGVSLLTIIAVLLVAPAAQSRAAWLAALVGCIYVLWSCRKRFPFIKRLSVRFKRLSTPPRVLLITGSLIFILGAATGVYLLKKDSANGRLLIWQVTSQLIKERPVTGHGSGAFSALYMDEQAQWFKSGKGTDEQAMVAGSPESPFNEPLKLLLEKGLIGVLLAAGILWIIFLPGAFNSKQETRNPKHQTRNSEPNTQLMSGKSPLGGFRGPETLNIGLKGTLISILTFSLFSYPFDISSFTLQLVVIVALLSSTTPFLITINGRRSLLFTMPIVVLLIAATGWYFPKRQAHYAALKTWQKANQFYNMRSYNIASEAYEEAFPVLKTNGLFLQMYSKALSMGEKHQKSSNMVPGLLLPKYLLAKLYFESGETEKAKTTAIEVLNSPVKVKSSATNEIMKEMKNIVTQSVKEETQRDTERHRGF